MIEFKNRIILLIAILSTSMFISCGNDEESGEVFPIAYNQNLLGTWLLDDPEVNGGRSVITITFNSDKTGETKWYWKDTKKTDYEHFTWDYIESSAVISVVIERETYKKRYNIYVHDGYLMEEEEIGPYKKM